jgi:hypothetical protein
LELLTCFLDNDIVIKLSAFDLFDEAIAVLNLDWTQLQVISTAQYTFRGKSYIAQYSEPVCQKAIAITQKCQKVMVENSLEAELLNGFAGIDIGEAALIVATRSQTDFLLLSGDKNCITQLAAIPEQIYKRLCGRVICLEQLILKLIEVKGFVFVCDRVLPMVSCDKSLQICFGYSSSASEENVIVGLNSYINDIRQQAPNLLANL